VTGNAPFNNVIYWHNVIVGQRSQFGYNTSGGIQKDRWFWSVKGNYWDILGLKSDTHNDPGEDGRHIGNWPLMNGVGFSGNIDACVTAITSNFIGDFPGLSSITKVIGDSTPASYMDFVDRQSFAGAGEDTGMGDYRLGSSSPGIGLAIDHVLSHDLDGVARVSADDTGAYRYSSGAGNAVRDASSFFGL
jgi:hypothetical protein